MTEMDELSGLLHRRRWPPRSGSVRLPDALRARADTLLVAVVAACALVPQLSRPGPEMDEGIVLSYAVRVLHGAVPYRDFQEFYGPGNVWSVAAAFGLFGVSQRAERVVGLTYLVVIVAATYVVVKRISRRAAIAGALITLAIGSDGGVWAYTTRGAVAALMVSIALATSGGGSSARRRHLRLAAAGVFAGATLLFRFDFVPPVLLAALVVLRPLGWRSRAAYLGSLWAVLLLYLPYLVLSGMSGIRRTARDILAVPSGRRLPIPSPLVYPGGWLLLGAATALSLLLIAGTLLARRRGSDATAPLAIGLASVGAIPFVLQRADPVHIESVAIVAYGLLPLAWVVLANRFRQSPVRRRACALVAFFAVLFGVGLFVAELVGSDILLVTHRSFYADGVDVKSRGRTFILGNRREAEASQSVLSVTDRLARPGDTVFVGPYDLRRAVYGPTYLYFLLPQLRPASYFMQFAPWTANRPGSSLARDILRADWIILVSKWDQIHEPNASSRLGPALPNQLVRSRFCLLIHDGSYRLFERRQPAARCERTVRRRLMRDASRASS